MATIGVGQENAGPVDLDGEQPGDEPSVALLGRSRERDVLDQVLADAREGRSAVLVIRGEAGIGKTALLRYVARQASGFRVAQVTGVEAEMELPFAGVH